MLFSTSFIKPIMSGILTRIELFFNLHHLTKAAQFSNRAFEFSIFVDISSCMELPLYPSIKRFYIHIIIIIAISETQKNL